MRPSNLKIYLLAFLLSGYGSANAQVQKRNELSGLIHILQADYTLQSKPYSNSFAHSSKLKPYPSPQKITGETPLQRAIRERDEADFANHPDYWAIQLNYSAIYGPRAFATGIYAYKRSYRRKSGNLGFGLAYHSKPAGQFPPREKNFFLAETFYAMTLQGRHLSARIMPLAGVGFDKNGIFLGSAGLMTGLGLSVWRFDANMDVGIYNFVPAMRFSLGYVFNENTHLRVREPWQPIREKQRDTAVKDANEPSRFEKNLKAEMDKVKKDREANPAYHGLRVSYSWDNYEYAEAVSISYFRRNYRWLSVSPIGGISFSKRRDYQFTYTSLPYTKEELILDAGGMLNIQGNFIHVRASVTGGYSFFKGGSESTASMMAGIGFTLWRLETNFEVGYFHWTTSRISIGYIFSDNKQLSARR